MAEFVAQSVAKIRSELEAVPFLTLDEKRKILKRHERLEYRLRKRQKKETDYLLYIQYCKDVLQLFRLRKKQRSIQSRAEVPVIKRIHRLYKLCETRFPQSTDVWLQHIEFCKQQKEFSHVGRLFTEMLQTHSTQPELWVDAAHWEIEQSNVEGARTLMQRCVATNKTSVTAWVQYYQLELEIAKSVRGKNEEIDDSNPTMTGMVARLVSKHARLQCPESYTLLQRLIEVADKFPFASSDATEMATQLKDMFADVPSVWDFMARRVLRKKKRNKKKRKNALRLSEEQEEHFFSIYEEAVSGIPTSEMWTLYLKAGLELLSATNPGSHRLHKRVCRVLELFQRAADLQCLAVEMLPHWLILLRQSGDTAAKDRAACEAMVRQFPHSAEVWRQCVGQLCSTLAAACDVVNCVQRAAKLLPDRELWTVWEPALQYLSLTSSEHLQAVLEKPCYSMSELLGAPARLFYLRWTAVNKDINATRQVFTRWFAVKPVSVQFYLEYISQELMQAIVDMKRVRQAFEHAITDHGKTDPELWLQYMRVEMRHGDPLLIGSLGTRALLNLPPGPLQEYFHRKTAGLTSS